MQQWQPGDFLFGGHFEVREVLGGSMGAVYLVENHRHEEDGRPHVMVAKTLQPDLADIPMLRKRFHEEARLWVNLPPDERIVRAYFCDYFLGTPYVLAEYVEPGIFPNTLSEWIHRHLTPPPVTLYLLSRVFGAMEHAYDNNVRLHGDLKPSNVLIDRVGSVKVADWGLSRPDRAARHDPEVLANRENPDAQLPDSLRNRGTPGYAAPELRERTSDPTSAADAYSVGVMLGEMLTRTRFTFETDRATIRAALEGSYPYRAGEVSALTETLTSLLQRDPDARGQALHANIDRLMQMLEDLTGFQRTPPSIIITPVDRSWLGQLMYSSAQLGDHAKALEAFTQLHRVTRKDQPEADKGVLIMNIDDGKTIASTTVIDALKREAEQHPDDVEKQLALASSYALVGDYARADAIYRHVLKRDESNEKALQGLIWTAESTEFVGRREKALALSYRLATLMPQTPKKWVAHARVCGRCGDLEGARQACERASQLGKLDAEALVVWGDALNRSGQPKAALRMFKRAVRADPESGLAYYNLGVVRRKLGQLKRSIRDFEKAVELEGPVGVALNHIATIHMQAGDLRAAVDALRRASKHAPDNPKIWFNMSQCMAAMGRNKDALRYLGVALSLDPNYQVALVAKARLEGREP